MINKDRITEMAIKAAAYRSPVLVPPKRTTSHSRTIKVRKKKKDEKESQEELRRSTGNVQPPHRYGRKVR